MNLSCGNCKTIRPVSGNPPRCDVCGEVCGTEYVDSSTTYNAPSRHADEDELYDTIHSAVSDALAAQPKKKSTLSSELLVFIGFIVLITVVPDSISRKQWFNKLIFSVEYSVNSSQVIQTMSGPPSDCDFLKAPIGVKGCEYVKKAEVQEATAENGSKKVVYVYWAKEETGK
jgi:hypothetical protein